MSLSRRLLWPHDYRVLFDLALVETDETAAGHGVEGNTVRDLYPGDYREAVSRRRRAGASMRSLEHRGLVERAGRRGGLVVWQTTAAGYDLIFREVD